MKTNRSARRLLKIRGIVIGLTLIALVGVAFRSGEYLASRYGNSAVTQGEPLMLPHVSLADLMAAAQ